MYLGENHVHPLYGVDSNLSITSIISILSTLVAPQLHQKSALWANRIYYSGLPSSVFRRSRSDLYINWLGGSI